MEGPSPDAAGRARSLDATTGIGDAVLDLVDQRGWQAWLTEHHGDRPEALLRIAKRGAPMSSLSTTEALDTALCFGWIDAVRRRADEHSFWQRYVPRRARSTWSAVNVARAEALIASGRMQPAGQAAVDAARADGRWDAAYPAQRDAVMPDDLGKAIAAAGPEVCSAYASLGRTERYLLVLPLHKAVTAAARAKALEKVLAALRPR